MTFPIGSRRRSGFTLVELLMVMTVLGVLLALTVPLTRSLYESSNLTLSGQTVGDTLVLARQFATSQNQPVEVRFIKANAGLNGYSVVQLWQNAAATGNPVPLDKAVALPSNIEISANATLSPMLNPAGLAGAASTMPTGNPQAGKSYVSFTVRPNGIVQVANPPADASAVA
ncbi:MAG: Verru_Chthon cassette protein D, partial [Rhodospirillales bacterium]|nr:Verru_Chthon cassette protein D [Acetobacter sp.]